MSNMRAAGCPPISTLNEPRIMTSGGPTQTARSPTRAAGIPPIRTVIAPGGRIGPPTCGTRTLTMGQTCISPTRAAGIGIRHLLLHVFLGEPQEFCVSLRRFFGLAYDSGEHGSAGGSV